MDVFMMRKQHALYAAVLLASSSLYAIPIESRGLSQNGVESTVQPTALATDTASAPTNLNWQIMQKTQQLENDIRTLRGKIEEQDNEIAQLKHELSNRYTDLDQRLELLQQKVDPDSAAPEEDKQQDISPSNASKPNSINVNPAKAQTTTPSTDLDQAAYTVALDAYKQGGAKKAIQPMQNFIKNHPNGIYAGNAYFWLADFYLALEPVNYKAAKQNYNSVATRYPNSDKASRSVYQLYSIAKDVDKNTALANQYKTKLLTQFPQSKEAKLFQKK